MTRSHPGIPNATVELDRSVPVDEERYQQFKEQQRMIRRNGGSISVYIEHHPEPKFVREGKEKARYVTIHTLTGAPAAPRTRPSAFATVQENR